MSKASANRLISKCKSWADFTAAVEKLDKKQMGDVFERLTKFYLQTKSLYKTSLKNVWLYSEIPDRVRREIKSLPESDEGIDLVAETKDGEFWAIQSKYRTDKDKPLTVKALSTFANLTFNVCKGSFVQAVVVHTVSKPVKKRELLPNTFEIGLQRWLEMDVNDWTLIRRTIGNKPARPKKRTARPHQRKAIRSAAKHFIDLKEPRGKLIMPCGTGKSLTAFWIANKLNAKTVLLVVPSLALIKQSVEDWTQEMVARGEDNLTEWLCICSDDSAGSVNKDDFVSDTYATGLPVTTDAKKIGAFLKKRTKKRKIVFVTYQSSPVFAKAARSVAAKFDLAVMDEAHKTAGERSKAFATLLFDKNLPIKKRIFMTATERVMRGANDDVVSMDKVDVYGDCFYQLSFKEAIHSDPPIISDYKILTIFVTEDEIRSAIKDRQFVSDRTYKLDAKDSRELAAAIALRKAYKKYGIKHAVSFHRSIQSASDFSDLQEILNASASLRPNVECFHISSKKTAGQRTELLKDFADSKRSLITNARCLTEGVDVPAIDCVLFADPKQSTVDIVQAAGRALRPHADKKFGYIMLPIIVPDEKNLEEFAETTEFKVTSAIITKISTMDGRIAEEFRVVERGKTRRGEIVQFDGNVPVGMKIDFEAFAETISAKVWQRAAKVNWRPFEEARAFVHQLDIKSRAEWDAIEKTRLPVDIPKHPWVIYEDSGWVSLGDWLGTGYIAHQNREYRTFGKARDFARSLNLSGKDDWETYASSGSLPADMPRKPAHIYKKQGLWKGWSDWLGNGRLLRGAVRPFEKARAFARKQKFNSRKEWQAFCRSGNLPIDIPRMPRDVYANEGWKGWGDWLGTGFIANWQKEYRPFVEAREFARSLKLKTGAEWRAFTKSGNLPDDIPATTHQSYENKGWKGMGDWLGTGRVASQNRKYRSFKEARKFARSLKLKTRAEWSVLSKSGNLPDDIPATAPQKYKGKGWKGWGDWLGTGNVASKDRRYRSFVEARKFARGLKLNTSAEWTAFTKLGNFPNDIPANVYQAYKGKGWKGMGDWLGTERVATQGRKYREFKEARKFARDLKLNTGAEWKAFTKSGNLPDDIPASPHLRYKNKGWKGIGDWLGTGNKHPSDRQWRSFVAARKFARSLKLKTGREWRQYASSGRLPEDIPRNPSRPYKDRGWKGIGDWLGTGSVAAVNRTYMSFEEARRYARSLELTSGAQWASFAKSKKLPEDVPRSPAQVYRAKGWQGWGDWLGTGRVAPGKQKYRPFKEAKLFVRSLNLNDTKSWFKFARSENKPNDIPITPDRIYKKSGWISWGDWLGTGRDRQWRSFSEARNYARSLKLQSGADWVTHMKSRRAPDDIPVYPNSAYKNKGWKGMGDWLGTGNVASKDRKYRSFKEARMFVRKLGLQTVEDWKSYSKSGKRPKDIPSAPHATYANKGWKGLRDWIGPMDAETKRKKRKNYLAFREAHAFVLSLNLKNQKEWRQYCRDGLKNRPKLPENIPATPDRFYKDDGWKSWGDWLGTGNVHSPKYRSFSEARKFSRSQNLKSSVE